MGNRCWHWSLMESARWQTDTISIHMKPVCSGFFANAWNNASQSMYEGPQWQMNGGSWASLVYDGRQRVCSHRLCVVVLAVCQRSIAIQANLQGCRDGCVCSCFLAGFSCCAAWFCILRVKSEGQIDECIFPGRGAQLWPGMAARELTRYPVARLRMINTSLVGGCFSHPPTMSWRSARTWNLQACGVYFGASPKMMWSRILQTRAATVLVGGCCRRGSRNPPYGGSFVELSAWPSLCEAGELGFLLLDDEALPWHGTLRALDGCSSSGRLPQLPLCLSWAHLSLATTGSLQCVMGEGPSPNWVQTVLDHPLMYPRLEERQLLLWRKYGLAMPVHCT